MKKTYNINLNGQIFCIDDDACLKLQSYIDTLESHYLKEEDGREIMADIESRIAELLKEALGKGYKQVVTMEDIDQIIRIMGSPDVIIDEDTDKSTEPIKRKLYRDTDESVLGGVASGIAAYFDISVVWIRIAFVLLAFFYGVTILVYIILWIATPAAVTARQKMEMKGEKINVSNIEKNIRDTYDDLKKNSGIQKFFTGVGNSTKTCFQKLNTILGKCLKIVFSVLSVVGLLAGTFLFILVFWCLLYPESITNFSIYHILYSSISSELLLTLKIILLLTLNIPLLLIIYISARYLFQFNWNKIFLLTAIGCWFLAGFVGIIITIQQSLSYSDVTEETEGHPFITTDTTSHKYLLKIDDLPQVSENSNIIHTNRYFANILAFDSIPPKEIYLKTFIRATPSTFSRPSLTIQKKIRGIHTLDHFRPLNTIRYHWEQNGNELTLDNYFKIHPPHWKGQEVEVTIRIPEGDTLVIQGSNKIRNNIIHSCIPFQGYKKNYTTVMKNGLLEIVK